MLALFLASGTGDPRVVHGGDINSLVAIIPMIVFIVIFVYVFRLAHRAVIALEKIADRLGGEDVAKDEPPSVTT